MKKKTFLLQSTYVTPKQKWKSDYWLGKLISYWYYLWPIRKFKIYFKCDFKKDFGCIMNCMSVMNQGRGDKNGHICWQKKKRTHPRLEPNGNFRQTATGAKDLYQYRKNWRHFFSHTSIIVCFSLFWPQKYAKKAKLALFHAHVWQVF